MDADHAAYTGVILALSSGNATFATDDPYCAYVVYGSEALHDQIFAQWRRSPFEGSIRPVRIAVAGTILQPDADDRAYGFKVQTVREVSLDFSDEDAARAFKTRMGQPLPKRRVGPDRNDPEERVRLTD